MQLVLDHGKLRPPGVMSRLAPQGSKGTTATATSNSATDPACPESTACAQALHELVTSSYLKPSTILSHISPQDKRILYEAEEKGKISGFPTAKELRQAREVAINRLKREEEEAEKVGLVRDHLTWVCAVAIDVECRRNPRSMSLQGPLRHVGCNPLLSIAHFLAAD